MRLFPKTFLIILLIGNNIFTHAQIVGAGKVVDPFKYTISKNQTVVNGGVVSAHPLASLVGLAILKKGGNAYDAVIATQLALAVVYPNAGNLGGGGFLVAHNASTKKNIAIDYREMAPAAANKDMYLDNTGNANTDISQNGHLASGVPGTIAGLVATHKYGKLSWSELVQPAVDLAEFGFIISQREADGLNGNMADFKKYSTTISAFTQKENWKAGDTLKQIDLSNTLRRIRDNGQDGFYKGATADLIVAEMQRGKGIITTSDLQSYTAKERAAINFKYKNDFTIISMPPPSSGGVMLHQMLNMVANKDLKKIGFQSPEYIQLLTEVERRAYADRAMYLGDADFFPIPLKQLTSKEYAAERMLDYTPNIAGISDNVKAGVTKKESEETTHISVADNKGNLVAVTTTLNGSYGSSTVVGGAGFIMNNEMDDFSVKPGVPNMYGALGGEANKIEPGKRMLSSMTPTIVLKTGKPFLVCGTPGGTTIITSVFQTVLNVVEFNMSAKDAVNKPKFHHQWYPDEIFVEKNVNPVTIAALTKMGYKITVRGGIGRTEVIKFLPNKKMELAADIRGDDSAAGF